MDYAAEYAKARAFGTPNPDWRPLRRPAAPAPPADVVDVFSRKNAFLFDGHGGAVGALMLRSCGGSRVKSGLGTPIAAEGTGDPNVSSSLGGMGGSSALAGLNMESTVRRIAAISSSPSSGSSASSASGSGGAARAAAEPKR